MKERKVAIGFICPDCRVKLEHLGSTQWRDAGACGEGDVTHIHICPQCRTMYSYWSDCVWDPPYEEQKLFEVAEKDPEVVKKKLAEGGRSF